MTRLFTASTSLCFLQNRNITGYGFLQYTAVFENSRSTTAASSSTSPIGLLFSQSYCIASLFPNLSTVFPRCRRHISFVSSPINAVSNARVLPNAFTCLLCVLLQQWHDHTDNITSHRPTRAKQSQRPCMITAINKEVRTKLLDNVCPPKRDF